MRCLCDESLFTLLPYDIYVYLLQLCIFITAMYIYNSGIYNSLTWFSDSSSINLFYNTKAKDHDTAPT